MFLALPNGKIVEATEIECMTHVKVVATLVIIEIGNRAGIVCGRAGFVRSGRIPERLCERVLRIQSETGAEAATERYLQRSIGIVAPAGLIVDFRVRVVYRRGSGDLRKLANGVNRDDLAGRVRPIHYAERIRQGGAVEDASLARKNPVGNTAQEKIVSLGTNITGCEHQLVRQFLLERDTVLINLFRNPVIARVRARLVLSIRRVGNKQ